MQALILCPASLINNWLDELYDWIPKSAAKKFRTISYVNADDPPVARLKKIFNWDEHGGILVMSYEMFRNFLSEKNSVRTSKEELRDLQGALLEGPSIIVADEAHKMKSVKSTIREVVDKFKSKARLALTGSPLANNLTEYWSMIDWVSPGYLGSQKEFKAHFVEPIEEGLYKDSTPYEHRKALKKLRVLKSEIGPKISRANITVLKDDLKSKVEFVITVPLTALQEELYNLCIRQLLVGDRKKITTTRMWVWIHLLNLLCCHPAVFVNKLKDQQARRDNAGDKPRANAQRAVVEESDANEQQDVLPEDQNLDDEMRGSFTNSFIEQAVSILDQAHDNTSPRHSFKTRILMQIIRLSKAAGDRVLVFSQQLNSLTYLESVLASQNYRYIRLDGKTKMSNRPALMEDFNRGKFDVFLISTKAGGTGFNLQGANRVIILDCGFNPQNEEQAIGRAYRIGQEKEVFVYRMIVGGTFEPKVWNSALFKTQLALRTVDAKNPERQAAKMREYFFEPTPVEQGDLTGDQGKDKKVLDKILAQQREGKDAGLRSITTTETLMTEDLDAVLNEEENEEVKKMIQAERLRKENPQAWEQYLRDNPAIDDSRNNPYGAMQRALFAGAAIRNGPAPIPNFPAARPPPMERPFLEFGAPSFTGGNQMLSTAPTSTRDTIRSDGLPSSDAGINNAGPSPASMRRQVPLSQTPRNPREILAPRDSASTPNNPPGPPKAPIPMHLRSDNRAVSPELGEDLPEVPGVNHSGPSSSRPKPLSPVSIVPLPLPHSGSQDSPSNPPKGHDQPILQATLQKILNLPRSRVEATGRDSLTSTSHQDGNLHTTVSESNRSMASPPKPEVHNSIPSNSFIGNTPTSNANQSQSTDETKKRVCKPDGEKASNSSRQVQGRPSWLPAAYANVKQKQGARELH